MKNEAKTGVKYSEKRKAVYDCEYILQEGADFYVSSIHGFYMKKQQFLSWVQELHVQNIGYAVSLQRQGNTKEFIQERKVYSINYTKGKETKTGLENILNQKGMVDSFYNEFQKWKEE